jgi:hypothetical protein
MKFIVNVLLMLFIMIAVSSCYNTPEKKIAHAIKEQGMFKAKILGVNIIDTIYEKEVKDTIAYDDAKIDSLNARIQRMRYKIDNLNKNLTRKETDSIRRNMLNQIRHMDGLRDFSHNRMWKLQQINSRYHDSIIDGYVVLLRTERDTLEYVLKSDFRMLGPKFIFEYKDRPKREFRTIKNRNYDNRNSNEPRKGPRFQNKLKR